MTPFNAVVWRIMFGDHAGHPTAPARAPEGRFHHDGQLAIYTSLTAKGAGTAIRRYLTAEDRPRVIVPLKVSLQRVLDLRDCMPPKDAIPATSVVWQDQRAKGARASTWDISDGARKRGAQGLLYRSRTHPGLSHLVVFDPSGPDALIPAGPPVPWFP